MYRIGKLSELTKVNKSTIRFYESAGFLAEVKRLSNGYRIYDERHKYQVIICSLVFSGFVNKKLRKASLKLIENAKIWDLEGYFDAAENYIKEIDEDIFRTKKAISTVMNSNNTDEYLNTTALYTKKQAALLAGTTEESIRNWERNGLLPCSPPYKKRFYTEAMLNRMHLIRLLLDTGYSIMAILHFLKKLDEGKITDAEKTLVNPATNEDFISRADTYLQTLFKLKEIAFTLKDLCKEMEKI